MFDFLKFFKKSPDNPEPAVVAQSGSSDLAAQSADPVEPEHTTEPETAAATDVVEAAPAEPASAEPAPAEAASAPAEAAPEKDISGEFIPPSSVGGGIPSGIPGFDYSPVDPNEEFKATKGEPLADGETVATEDEVVEALRTVYDPEIPVNIYDLGLIYGLTIGDKGRVDIDMTLTAPGCPVAGEMPGMVADAVEKVAGTGEIEVLLVWEPQWTPENMSEDAKLALGMD